MPDSMSEKIAQAFESRGEEMDLAVRRAVYRATVLGNAALILEESEYEKVGLGKPKPTSDLNLSES